MSIESLLINPASILLCDGGMGTQLQSMGLVPGECPEAWCLTRPEAIRAIHQAYAAAGCDILETNSFGASVYKLRHFGMDERIAEINRAAASLAREVAGPERFVFGSIGPTGAFLEPYGDETEANFLATFRMQAQALRDGGVDAIIVETMTAVEECCLAIRAAREIPGMSVIAAFTFQPHPNGRYVSMMGVSPTRFAHAATEAGAQIIGANCGTGVRDMVKILEELHAAVPTCPLLAMPNAGMPTVVDGATVFDEAPEETAAAVPALLNAGARIIGGCCGTTPAHSAALRQALDAACPRNAAAPPIRKP